MKLNHEGDRLEYIEGVWATLVRVQSSMLFNGKVYMTVDLLLDDGTELLGYIL